MQENDRDDSNRPGWIQHPHPTALQFIAVFQTVTEHNRKQIALSAVKETVATLEKEFSDELVSVTAFGNFAKGKRFDEIDLLIVLKEIGSEQGARQRIAQTIGERVFARIYRKYHLLFNVLIHSQAELKATAEHPERKFPLWHDIAKHGIVLWGEEGIE
jgi:hypothetical protein